jgi:anti-sigma B factor antagonist
VDQMTISTEERPGAVILRLRGAAGMWAAGDLELAVDDVLARKTPLAILEMSGLDFVASIAMGQFLRLATSQRDSGGRAAAAAPPREIELALRRGRIDSLLPIYPSLDAALAGAPAGPPPVDRAARA